MNESKYSISKDFLSKSSNNFTVGYSRANVLNHVIFTSLDVFDEASPLELIR